MPVLKIIHSSLKKTITMKNVILTGSSSGFGLAAAKKIAAKGHTVYATMRNIHTSNAAVARELQDWAAKNKAAIEVVELDVTNETSARKAIAYIAERSGGVIDVLINNAGLYYIGIAEALTMEQTEQLFQVNVLGADRMIKSVLPFMHRQKDGLIINITSIQARNWVPVVTTYNATKAALDALSVGYHYELRSAGIDLVTIQPGIYETTDIVTKSLQAGNPAVEASYGENMIRLKHTIKGLFDPREDSTDPGEVGDAMLQLMEMPKGKRPLWTITGFPLADQLDAINQSIKALVEGMLSQFDTIEETSKPFILS
jgi:NAD(P)-dependent dehydrogenase (short-subunit alcohol dehydrogenase family)